MPQNVSATGEKALSPKQNTLISALLAGHTITVAAAAAGVNQKTAHAWLKLPHVQSAYQVAQKELFDEALAGLRLKVQKAIDTLDRNMSSDEVPASSQIRAAQIVIEQAIAVHKMSELEAKVAELERAVKDVRT